jgi:hypothetical protein
MTRYQFDPPPRIKTMADLDCVARTHAPTCQAIRAAAVHESAHALAAIIFKRPSVMVILRSDGAGKTWYYPVTETVASLYREAVISFCGVVAEQVIQGTAKDIVSDAALSDHANAMREVGDCAAAFMKSAPLDLREWAQSLSPKKRAALKQKAEDKVGKNSLRESRALVRKYWPLIVEMAYVALRDSKEGVHWWVGQPLDWVRQRIAEIDAGKQARKLPIPARLG